MPLVERLLHSMLVDDAARPAFQLFGVACDSGLRLKTPLFKIVNHHCRRYHKPEARLNRHRKAHEFESDPDPDPDPDATNPRSASTQLQDPHHK